jgi:hypothetical protein
MKTEEERRKDALQFAHGLVTILIIATAAILVWSDALTPIRFVGYL